MKNLILLLALISLFNFGCKENPKTEPAAETESTSLMAEDGTTIICTCTDSNGNEVVTRGNCSVDGYCDCRKSNPVVCCSSPCVE